MNYQQKLNIIHIFYTMVMFNYRTLERKEAYEMVNSGKIEEVFSVVMGDIEMLNKQNREIIQFYYNGEV